jgi:hypothetical protein
MQNLPTNPNDSPLERGIKALREEAVPEAPTSLVVRMVPDRHPGPTRSYRWGAAVGLACSLAVAVVVMWPKASAAEDLKRVVGNMGVRDVLCHQKNYTIDSHGRRTLTMELYVKGSRVRMINHQQDGSVGEQVFDGGRMVVYSPSQGYGTSEVSHFGPDNFAPARSLQFVLSNPANRSVEKDAAIRWNGRLADKYVVNLEFVDGRNQTQRGVATLYADPQTDRPLYQEVHFESMPGGAVEWDYPPNSDALLALSAPAGTPIYDLALQREQVLASVLTPMATDTVGGRTITLRGVFVDEQNNICAIYSGGDGRPGIDPDRPNEATIEVLNVAKAQLGWSIGGQERVTDRRYIYLPTTYKGLSICVECGDLPKSVSVPEAFTLKVPVWFTNGAGEGARLKLAGFARFEVKHPVRTSALNYLLAPTNLSIFRDDSAKRGGLGAPTSKAD